MNLYLHLHVISDYDINNRNIFLKFYSIQYKQLRAEKKATALTAWFLLRGEISQSLCDAIVKYTQAGKKIARVGWGGGCLVLAQTQKKTLWQTCVYLRAELFFKTIPLSLQGSEKPDIPTGEKKSS